MAGGPAAPLPGGGRGRRRGVAGNVTGIEACPALVDGLADLAGEYFASLAALSGAGYKLEMNLARFYRRHLAPSLGGSHLPLLAGFGTAAGAGRPAVASLDW